MYPHITVEEKESFLKLFMNKMWIFVMCTQKGENGSLQVLR